MRLNIRWVSYIWALPLFVLLVVACGDNTATPVPPATTAAVAATHSTTTTAAVTTAATTTTAVPNPTLPLPTQADTTAEAGRQAFAKVCAGCHLGQGTQAGKAPVLALSTNAINADFVRNQVRKGGKLMPPISTSRISDADLENVIVYLKAIHKS
ncbi:MAG: cytochrome c [Chloroflexi bacterium]|uniref:Cytochrome c n=1 Tax=Candidatus Chlorohelix allophototropha TaxID=3003348 RepID=A0A8T7LWQ6_9CHLR|nr:cytochrome c [Chloroflexota bacterium]WJW65764.1 cytochrome c [Chloroflexota bacterium L227-S17]